MQSYEQSQFFFAFTRIIQECYFKWQWQTFYKGTLEELFDLPYNHNVSTAKDCFFFIFWSPTEWTTKKTQATIETTLALSEVYLLMINVLWQRNSPKLCLEITVNSGNFSHREIPASFLLQVISYFYVISVKYFLYFLQILH